MDTLDAMLTTVPGVKVTKLGFLSQDGITQVKALMWEPRDRKAVSPRGIIHIAHSMEEYVGRYVDFANYLASQGFVVCAADMIGHGRSIASPEKLSCIPLENGKDILIEDVHELRKTISARFSRQTPYFVFGHSMGSALMRAYIACHGEGLKGAILCGASQRPLILSKAGNFFAKRLAGSKGADYKSGFLEKTAFRAYGKKIENPRTQHDWICSDDAVVDAYIADPLCGVPFSVGGYAALTDLTAEAVTASNAAKVPKDLPVLFISGALDPAGENGVGVEKSARLLRNAGVRQVEVRLYEGMRHEILNEPGKREVYTDIVQWIGSVTSGT